MNRCILAIFFEEKYTAIICHHKEGTNIRDILKTHHNSIRMAKILIARGDLTITPKNDVIDFHHAWGYSWDKVKPAAHQTPESLVDFCSTVNASFLHVFEIEGWQEIFLSPKPKPLPGTRKSTALYVDAKPQTLSHTNGIIQARPIKDRIEST